MVNKKQFAFAITLISVILSSVSLFLLCYQFDNKYTAPRPAVVDHEIPLNMRWYDSHPLFYLIDGWSFYQGKLLTPEEISGQAPDASFYIGRYSGFDLGDPSANPHGQGTYHIRIVTDGNARQYALELTEIYSSWRLWVNGVLLQSVGFDDDSAEAPSTPHGFVTFTAKDSIDIVIQAADNDSFYSGMVYPPAIGSPKRVSHNIFLRFLIHGFACSLSLALFVFCATAGIFFRFHRPYGALALLSLCFCVSAAWPLLQTMNVAPHSWVSIERCCYYGMFLLLIWLQGRICRLPRKFYLPICTVGAAICLGVLLLPFHTVRRAGTLMAFADILATFKWLTALWLLFSICWAVRQKRPYSSALLAGDCVFAVALILDKLLPLFEPILYGWFVELAGAVLLLLIGGIVFFDAVRLYRMDAELRAERKVAQLELRVRSEHADLQQEYIRRTQRQLHESRNRLTLISHYLNAGELDSLRGYLSKLTDSLEKKQAEGPYQYTGNSLVDAILSVQLTRAAQENVYVEQELDTLPSSLPYTDSDLTSLLMNLMDNALEASLRLRSKDPDAHCWIDLSIRLLPDGLLISCANAAPSDSDPGRTSKADQQAHGFGLSLLQDIARHNGGHVKIEQRQDSFSVSITLKAPTKDFS